jgi:hypothetical protein
MDNKEIWNLDISICKFIIPRLEIFKEQVLGHPPGITKEEWIEVLDKMLQFFKKYVNDEIFVNAEEEEGFQLFFKYFNYLWW